MTTDDFNPTYDLYRDAIFRYCTLKCSNSEIGQDLTQETFMRFYICLQREEKIRHARAFLYRIAHNLFINHVRKKKEDSLDQLLESGYEPTVNPWHETFSQIYAGKPLKTLRNMRSPYKQVLTRRFIQGLSPSEIASATGETSNTISVRIFRGLKHLRLLLQQEEGVQIH